LAHWTNEEIDFLIKNSEKYSISYLAEKCKRSYGAIYKKCIKLNLKILKENGYRIKFENNWTDNDIVFLKKYYLTRSNFWLSQKINKSVKSIITKIKNLKLTGKRCNEDHLHWEQNEIDYVVEHWQQKTDIELAEYINNNFNIIRKRTPKTIFYLRRKLGIKRPIQSSKSFTKTKTWTMDDEDFLVNNYYNMSHSEIANCLNKTESSIANKARRLNLKLFSSVGVKWDKLSIDYLKENFNQKSINCLARELQISVEKILAKSIELNLAYQVKQLTNPEIFIKNSLENLNINFEFQKKILYENENHTTKSYIVDYIIDNTIIEVQGDYYHCNPKIYKNGAINSIQVNNITRDKSRKERLELLGYNVIYIWEDDIKNNPQNVIEILATLFSNK